MLARFDEVSKINAKLQYESPSVAKMIQFLFTSDQAMRSIHYDNYGYNYILLSYMHMLMCWINKMCEVCNRVLKLINGGLEGVAYSVLELFVCEFGREVG